MIKITARKLLQYSTDDLWSILTGTFCLVFDNNEEIITNYKETNYSSYAWDFHRNYPNTPLLPKHHVRTILGNNRLGSRTHLNLLGSCMWSVYDAYVNSVSSELEFRDLLAEKVYSITNLMYNDLSFKLEEYVVSLDVLDFISALNNPAIKAANTNAFTLAKAENTNVATIQKTLSDTYSEIEKALFNDPALKNNPISLASSSKLVKMGQVLQCIGPRGLLTDIDSHQFRKPVLRGYAQGIRSLHDSLIESRSAAKSLAFSKSTIRDAEYFSRRLQLMAQVVKNLHYADCGSNEYVLWKVIPDQFDNGELIRKGNLNQLIGKYYLDENGSLKTISKDSKELIGKTIKIRSAIHCAHPDPYGICSTCFGELSTSVPADTNIGQICCTSLAQQSSQSVLSVKHLDTSASIEGIMLDPIHKQLLRVAADNNSYLLSENLKGKNISIIIPAIHASNITDIVDVRVVEDLNITRVSELYEIGVKVGDNGVMSIPVNINKRLASMTYPLLHYIRSKGWVIDDNGNYVIDMSDWDYTKPILTLPLRHFNMSDHSKDVASLLESSVGKMRERDTEVSPNAMLIELFDLVNDKLNVNLAVLEVVLYSAMIVSAENGDFSLPKPWTDHGVGVMEMSMKNRSLSAMMAYEDHQEVVSSPSSYINTNRTDHLFDRILMCGEFESTP